MNVIRLCIEEDWLHTDVGSDKWSNSVSGKMTSLNHVITHSATSASSDKTAFAFDFFDVLYDVNFSSDTR